MIDGDCRKSAKIETSKNIIITKPLRIGVSNLDCYIITPRKEGFPTISDDYTVTTEKNFEKAVNSVFEAIKKRGLRVLHIHY